MVNAAAVADAAAPEVKNDLLDMPSSIVNHLGLSGAIVSYGAHLFFQRPYAVESLDAAASRLPFGGAYPGVLI